MLTTHRMNRCAFAVFLAVAFQALSTPVAEAADAAPTALTAKSPGKVETGGLETTALDARLDDLIEQLGSKQFTVRRAAAGEIRKIGPEAFDRLHAATESPDPEIAASANYLMRQIAVRWTRGDDSATVKQLMGGFSDREDIVRQRIIQTLGALPDGEGVGPLCRIARFDRMPALSRLAAMVVVQIGDDETVSETVSDANEGKSPKQSIDPAIFDRELGESNRTSVLWLRQFQLQLRDPTESVAGWQRLIAEEEKRLAVDDNETSPAIVSALLWNLADVYRQLGDTGQLVQTADRVLAVDGVDTDKLLESLLKWFVKHQSWDALEQVAQTHDDKIHKSKRTLYLLAMARSKQNRADVADKLAKQAAELRGAKPFDGLEAAQLLVQLGQYDWAVREYESDLKDQPVESVVSIGARVQLSDLLRDYEHYEAAAEAISPLCDAIEKNPDVGRAYANAIDELGPLEVGVPQANELAARMHYLRACHFEQEHDFKHQREELLKAIKADENDADVLISMYRMEDADDAWMADTRKRIVKLSRKIDEQIADSPSNPIWYNQWAWLIANTEGDYPKAVRYSRRSLELMPDTPSFLDTLGRCYYSAGELEKAIEAQQQAIALVPHMQVMQRQLAEFEQALAKKEQGTGGTGPRAAKPD
jgi:tetratricopeptide (TPR) repeat protein